MPELPAVLVVDDELRSQETLRRTLDEDFQVFTASDTREAERVLEREWVHVVLCDQRMPDENGVEFLARVRERWPDVVRIIISGYTDSEDIIAGINDAGIYQYITKPWKPESLLLSVSGAARLFRLQRENEALTLEIRSTTASMENTVGRKRRSLRSHFDFSRLVRSEGSPLDEVCELATRIAAFDISVLVTGESGTGKELLARALHYGSPRAEQPFVVQNCGALPDQLLESELFGYKKGAFTGAYEDRVGLFSRADGGTLFLDEIGDISPAFQVKLLRALQEGEIRPLGSPRTRRIDVRVIAATNRDLEEEVRAGRFREDLYYRLAGFSIHVPPLRDRPADVEPIARHILTESMARFGKRVAGFSPDAIAHMGAYPWPGNVRELGNEVQRMLALAEGTELDAGLLSSRVRGHPGPDAKRSVDAKAPDPARLEGNLRDRIEMLERRILEESLSRHRWNKSRAADELGLSRVGLRAKLQRYGLDTPGLPPADGEGSH